MLLKKQTFYLGNKPWLNHSSAEFAAIHLVYDQFHAYDRACLVMLLAVKLKRLLGHNVSLTIMQQQHIAHWCASQNIVYCHITHKAQNTRYVLSIMHEYLQYIDTQFLVGSYYFPSIVNMDETKIYFDMEGGLTLADRGAKTISLRTNGSSMRCTVLLGASMSGEKLALFVFSKEFLTPGSRKNLTIITFLIPHRWIIVVRQRCGLLSLFSLWICYVWKSWTISHGSTSQPSYLLLDDLVLYTFCSKFSQKAQ